MIECCFHMELVELLREQSETMFMIKRKITDNRNVLRLFDLSFDKPPYFLMFEHFEGKDLKTWASEKGGAVSIPFSSRLELVAQIASGLQGIFDAKVLHKTLTPDHILVAGTGQTLKDVQAKITNLSIGHIRQRSNQDTLVPHENQDAEDTEEVPPPDDSDMYAAPEVVAGLKREALIPFFVENPAERPATPGKIAQELRSYIKNQEARSVESGKRSRRQMIETTISVCLAVIAITVLAIFGPKFLGRDDGTKTVSQTTPAEEIDPDTVSSKIKDMDQSDSGYYDESDTDKSPSDSGNSSSRNPTRKDSEQDEPEKPAITALKYLGFPLCVVIVIGTLIRQLGPGLHHWFDKRFHSDNTD